MVANIPPSAKSHCQLPVEQLSKRLIGHSALAGLQLFGLGPQDLFLLMSFELVLLTNLLQFLQLPHFPLSDLSEASISPPNERPLEPSFVQLHQLVLDLCIHLYLEVAVASGPIIEITIESLAKHLADQVTCSPLAFS